MTSIIKFVRNRNPLSNSNSANLNGTESSDTPYLNLEESTSADIQNSTQYGAGADPSSTTTTTTTTTAAAANTADQTNNQEHQSKYLLSLSSRLTLLFIHCILVRIRNIHNRSGS